MAQAQNLADPVATAPGTTAEHPGRFDVAAVLVADGQRQVFTVGMSPNAADRDPYVLWAPTPERPANRSGHLT